MDLLATLLARIRAALSVLLHGAPSEGAIYVRELDGRERDAALRLFDVR
jgi:hypothetical protein